MRSRLKKATIIVLAILTGIYILVCAAVYTFQKRIIFLPSQCSDPPPGDLNIQEKYLATTGGQVLHAWWMPIDSSEYTILYLHGNAGCVGRSEERMRFYKELGYSTFEVDYRGYGKSTGDITREEDIYDDAQSAMQFLEDSLGVAREKIIVWGWSLGGAVAVNLTQHSNVALLVLEGTFFSMDDIASRAYPLFPTRRLLKYHFRSGEKIANVKVPIFFIHSSEDLTIPYEQGRKLYDTATGDKQFLDIKGSHNHGYYEERTKIREALRLFLREKRGKL
jgi:pimeloyl-ACP methyl ester carboxylesterase